MSQQSAIPRRQFLKYTGVVAGTIALSRVVEAQIAATGRRPNILFLFSDDHALNAISAYSKKLIDTPNIDRIANEGAIFSNCYCCNSLCAPSRAAVLTGKHSQANGLRDNNDIFNGKQTTYPKLLQQAGYTTAMFGKWHLKSDPTGFDAWEIHIDQGQYYNPDFLTHEGKVRIPGYATEIVANHSIQWLKDQRDKNKPFLLHCWFKAPHRNWLPDLKHLKLFKDTVFPEPDSLFDDYANRASPASKQEMNISDLTMQSDLKLFKDGKGVAELNRMTPEERKAFVEAYKDENDAFLANPPTGKDLIRWKYQRYIRDYLRCVVSVDENVGKILKYLDESGLDQNTIVVYSSDQGFYLGEHGWFDKRWMYEESFHMPLLMRWPGVIEKGTKINALVQNIDFASTFLAAAGMELPVDLHGVPMQPTFTGKTPDTWRKSLYYHYYEFPGEHHVARHCGVRTEQYKLIWYYQTNEWELFDLTKDPSEMKSIYADPDNQEIIKQLKTELIRLRKQYNETEPDKEPTVNP